MEIQDRKRILNEAAEKLEEAIKLIEEGMLDADICERQAQAYIIPHLEQWIRSSHQIGSIRSLKECLDDELRAAEDEEDDE